MTRRRSRFIDTTGTEEEMEEEEFEEMRS